MLCAVADGQSHRPLQGLRQTIPPTWWKKVVAEGTRLSPGFKAERAPAPPACVWGGGGRGAGVLHVTVEVRR